MKLYMATLPIKATGAANIVDFFDHHHLKERGYPIILEFKKNWEFFQDFKLFSRIATSQ